MMKGWVMRTINDSRNEWKQHIKAKLLSKGFKIEPWLEKHIDYLALLSPKQFKAEIEKFNKEQADAAEVRP